MFAIELQSPQGAEAEGGRAAAGSGRITIGDFTEAFRVRLGFWDESGYRRSWRRAFEVLNADPRATSCLMTSMTDPRESNFLICWPMSRAGEDVYIQHALILLAETEDFDLAAPWDHIGPRRGTDEDGKRSPSGSRPWTR